MNPGPRASDFPFFPSFFLVGAPRCGTTSISRQLASHPQICFSRPKELYYFNRATADSLARIREDYLDRHFGHCDPGRQKVYGEGSVSYLYEPDAIRQILAVQPAARFIVAVRNPIDMLRSYHFRLLYVLEEDQKDFGKAWDLQEARLRGECLPRGCTDPHLLNYREVASLGFQVERLMQITGPERCYVVVNDDLKERPEEVYRTLLRFIGADADAALRAATTGGTRFPHRLKSRTYRWRWLQTLIYKPVKTVFAGADRSEVQRKLRRTAPFLKRLRKRLRRFNTIRQAPLPIAPELRAQLRETFDADLRKLGEILGRDLSHWN